MMDHYAAILAQGTTLDTGNEGTNGLARKRTLWMHLPESSIHLCKSVRFGGGFALKSDVGIESLDVCPG